MRCSTNPSVSRCKSPYNFYYCRVAIHVLPYRPRCKKTQLQKKRLHRFLRLHFLMLDKKEYGGEDMDEERVLFFVSTKIVIIVCSSIDKKGKDFMLSLPSFFIH